MDGVSAILHRLSITQNIKRYINECFQIEADISNEHRRSTFAPEEIRRTYASGLNSGTSSAGSSSTFGTGINGILSAVNIA